MSDELGRRVRKIAEGYVPGASAAQDRATVSHETPCIVNAGNAPAEIEITLYFSDPEPAGPCPLTVPTRRTKHLRFNDLTGPEPVPRDTDYASIIRSSAPVVVQHTRLDSRQPPHARFPTVAWAAESQ